jgi:dienelactone hydrolase
MSDLAKVAYRDGETDLTGQVAWPGSAQFGAPRGAVVVFPTIANATPATQRRARMLADAGYVAFIADLYGFTPDGQEAVQAAARDLRGDVDVYRARVRAALAAMRTLPGVSDLPQAAIGYCMGGQAALELARSGADIAGVVSFHGILQSDRPATGANEIAARILVCHGDADPLVPREQVFAFWQEMDAARANWHFHAYSGVRHGFTDPGSDARGIAAIGYDASADRQSWAAMLSFFEEIFEAA